MSAVALYGGYWPFPRLRWLRVSSCTFSVEWRSYGRFQLTLASDDLSPNDLAPDALIGIVAPPLPAWAGVVDDVAEEGDSGLVRVAGREYAVVLSERLTRQRDRWQTGDAGILAEEELRRASARNPTGVGVGFTGPGGIVSAAVETSGQTLQEFFERLADLSGYEWQFSYECGSRLRVTWQWRFRAGHDLRTAIHLRALSDAEYGRRMAAAGVLVRAVGGSVSFRDRPSHVRLQGGSAPFHNRLAATIDVDPRPAAGVSILHGAEQEILDPMAGTARSVSSLTRRALEQPWVFSEQLEFALPLERWPEGLTVGSVIGIRLPSARLGAGLVRSCRVLGYQADLQEGSLSVIGGLDAT